MSKLAWYHPVRFSVTWFGVGLVPKASGTAGSLAALPFAYFIHSYAGNFGLMLSSLLLFALGVWLCHLYLDMQGGPDDPGEIVIDEVAGQWLVLSALYPSDTSYIVGFLLFRFFDIFKPYPVSWADRRIKGGFGVMLDDLMAACYPFFIFIVVLMVAAAFGEPLSIDPLMNYLARHHVF